jgi:hypothetical protein
LPVFLEVEQEIYWCINRCFPVKPEPTQEEIFYHVLQLLTSKCWKIEFYQCFNW